MLSSTSSTRRSGATARVPVAGSGCGGFSGREVMDVGKNAERAGRMQPHFAVAQGVSVGMHLRQAAGCAFKPRASVSVAVGAHLHLGAAHDRGAARVSLP